MNKTWEKKLSKDMPKDQFYDIDTLKEKVWFERQKVSGMKL